jgi:hypothetical protein
LQSQPLPNKNTGVNINKKSKKLKKWVRKAGGWFTRSGGEEDTESGSLPFIVCSFQQWSGDLCAPSCRMLPVMGYLHYRTIQEDALAQFLFSHLPVL